MVFGAAYTDLNVRKNALMILTIVAVASGVLILVNAYLRGIRLFVGAVALFVVLAVLLGVVWPNATQRLQGPPCGVCAGGAVHRPEHRVHPPGVSGSTGWPSSSTQWTLV